MVLNKSLYSKVIRGCQLALSIVCLGLGAKLVDEFSWDYNNLVVATSVISLVWLVVVCLPQWVPSLLVVFGRVGVTAIGEFVVMVLWLASFGVMADQFGSASCSRFYTTFCEVGKAAIAMTIVQWLLFVASFVLFIMFSVVPVVRNAGAGASFNRQFDYYFGSIFVRDVPLASTVQVDPENPENPVAVESSISADGKQASLVEPTIDKIPDPEPQPTN
ncbi:hypothetical protein DIURU_004089 [Diutina rugosa]|uniref:MARVEL domain-containing protein n=1 Tax=Diutina rugosa TaxID=5481 RepID=A0A642UIR1_DIURU|nr:uncharacterized protein DIURU_004089 [Diutina rugosa]KAA8899832.1 hypothetical protein DIURU_004089 [Diutina rugosa]